MNNSIIPIELYAPIYYHAILLAVIILALRSTYLPFNTSKIQKIAGNYLSSIFLISTLLYIGLRPTHEIFVDMPIYESIFIDYGYGISTYESKDFGFHLLLLACSKVMPPDYFFIVCATLYVIPLYFASRRIFGEAWVYAFIFLVGSFSFWGYATNGIRNGIASSFLLLAISQKSIYSQVAWSILSISFHKAMALPAIAFFATNTFNDHKKYLIVWISCIFLSVSFGDLWARFFSDIGIKDDRLIYLTTSADNMIFSSTGFRWDFLLYSFSAIAVGIRYLSRTKDQYYSRIINTYMLSNSVWILVMQANYSNRFAYLSWFMIGLVFSYPIIKESIKNHNLKKITAYLAGYFSFTYVMGVFN